MSSTEWWRPELPLPAPLAESREGSEPASSAVPFWSLMGFTLVLLVAPQSIFPALAPLRLAMLTAGLAIVAYLWDRLVRHEPLLRMTREVGLAMCLAAWAILTVPWSYWPAGSVAFLLDIYFKTLAVFLLLGAVINTRSRLRRVAWCLVLISIPIALTALRNYVSGAFAPNGVHANVKRIMGYEYGPLTGNPNDLALMLNLILPFGVALFLIGRRPLVRALLFSIILLYAAAVITTFSRAGFLTLVTVFTLYIAKLLKRSERPWALIALLVFCLPLVPAGYWQQMGTITDIEADPSGSAQVRWNDLAVATAFAIENPIVGVGVGMNILAMNEQRGAAWRVVHNAYLEYAIELGLPGLALFCLLLMACERSAARVQRETADRSRFSDLFHLAEAVQISLIAFAVAALFYPVGYLFYFYYFAGLAVAARAIHEAERDRHAQDAAR